MPTVGAGMKKRRFSYTPNGEAAAMDYGQQTGQKVVKKKKMPKKPPRRMK